MPLERGASEIGGRTGTLAYFRKNRTTKEVAKSVVASFCNIHERMDHGPLNTAASKKYSFVKDTSLLSFSFYLTHRIYYYSHPDTLFEIAWI